MLRGRRILGSDKVILESRSQGGEGPSLTLLRKRRAGARPRSRNAATCSAKHCREYNREEAQRAENLVRKLRIQMY